MLRTKDTWCWCWQRPVSLTMCNVEISGGCFINITLNQDRFSTQHSTTYAEQGSRISRRDWCLSSLVDVGVRRLAQTSRMLVYCCWRHACCFEGHETLFRSAEDPGWSACDDMLDYSRYVRVKISWPHAEHMNRGSPLPAASTSLARNLQPFLPARLQFSAILYRRSHD